MFGGWKRGKKKDFNPSSKQGGDSKTHFLGKTNGEGKAKKKK